MTDFPLAIRHVDGRITYVLYNASVYKDEDGRVQGVFAAARDVTAQRAASAYSRSLIEASLDPLVTISSVGEITDVNSATENVTGVSRSQLVGSDFSIYFTEPDKAREGTTTTATANMFVCVYVCVCVCVCVHVCMNRLLDCFQEWSSD